MIVSINQPAYLPWPGYFHRIAASDKHIVLDHVQFEKNSFTNRNKIRTKDGWCWLTVPVVTSKRFGNLRIDELEIVAHSRWAEKHTAALKTYYSKAPHYRCYAGFFEKIYRTEWQNLKALMWEINRQLLKEFAVETPVLFSSKMKSSGTKDELILNLCREAEATTYLSGLLGRQYLREALFEKAGIKVIYDDFESPTYPQVYPDFVPGLSAVDLLFNLGPEASRIFIHGKSEQTVKGARS